MNKLIITIVTALLLTAGSFAFSQDSYAQQGRKGPPQKQGMQKMPMIDGMLRAFRHLDLSEEQKESVKATVKGLREDIKPLMLEARELHKQMGELVRAAEYDAGAVAALADQEGDLLAERIKLTAAAMSQARSYLSDEQREQLANMAEKRKQRGKGNRDRKRKDKPQAE